MPRHAAAARRGSASARARQLGGKKLGGRRGRCLDGSDGPRPGRQQTLKLLQRGKLLLPLLLLLLLPLLLLLLPLLLRLVVVVLLLPLLLLLLVLVMAG
jgi:hypothetical protein